MIRMETTDIVIHKGEKDKKYQLYVEDYVMSYLKNYGHEDVRKIFFYGTRDQKEKKYYIYGAGRQKNISYFVRYELLDEIVCRFDMDMPVFSIKEDSKRYELKGYYVFYQSNEAMQGYMVEQCKESDSVEKEQDKFKTQSRGTQFGNVSQSKIRPQDFSDIRARNGLKKSEEEQGDNKNISSYDRTNVRKREKDSNKGKGGLLAFQLAAVFLVLAAIIINSTNSYSKLRELGQSAVEVFFAMENQDAVRKDDGKDSNATQESQKTDSSQVSKGTVLRLEDLDSELEKENQMAKQDETDENTSEIENEASEAEKESSNENEASEAEKESSNENGEGEAKNNSSNENVKSEANNDSGNADDKNSSSENGVNEDTNNSEGAEKTDETNNEPPQSQEAFARNLTEYYQIEKGDTLSNISIKKYGDASKVKEICEINKIEDPDNIKYGQKIILP